MGDGALPEAGTYMVIPSDVGPENFFKLALGDEPHLRLRKPFGGSAALDMTGSASRNPRIRTTVIFKLILPPLNATFWYGLPG